MFVAFDCADVSVTDAYLRVSDNNGRFFVCDNTTGELSLNGRVVKPGTLEYLYYNRLMKKIFTEFDSEKKRSFESAHRDSRECREGETSKNA